MLKTEKIENENLSLSFLKFLKPTIYILCKVCYNINRKEEKNKKKKCKANTNKIFNESITKFFNDTIKDIENLTTNIPSREDIVLTRSHSSTCSERLEHSICEMN